MSNDDLKLHIELNVIKHLGIGLYSSTPSVVTEIIANAWDADAAKVSITLDIDNDRIQVEDDGHGMAHEHVQNKFLAVGYSRRTSEDNKERSRSGERRVMGRKGIGKLAMFSLANTITIATRSNGSDAVAFTINVKKLLDMAKSNPRGTDYPIKKIKVPDDFTLAHGTRITLTELNSRITKTEAFLRPRLARRFGVFSDTFQVSINGRNIVKADAGYYNDLQFLWYFDELTRDAALKNATAIASYKDDNEVENKCVRNLDAVISSDLSGRLQVRGFIASVDKPSKLGKGDESLNRLSVFANGRLFQEDILPDLGDARYFNSYLVGEIHADFLDEDDEDRATASRESIRHDDERFQALRAHMRSVFSAISEDWDNWRTAQDYEKSVDKNQAIEEWLSGLKDNRDRKAANRLITSIDKITLNNDEDKDKRAKNILYKSAIIGFEKLRARDQLSKLDKVKDVFSPEFQAIFASLDELEASYYVDIVRGRLDIIEKFEKEIVDVKALEKIAQKYLFDHLWLLDPTWDKVTGNAQMEVTLTAELKRACPDAETGARLDIAYRTTSGRHVIIELKRPGLSTKADELEAQGRKYCNAMKQWFIEHPDAGGMKGRVPPIDIYFLTEKAHALTDPERTVWDAYNLKSLTYKGLIGNARSSYQEYLDVKNKVKDRLATLMDNL